jgi:uncharacterized membrane protein
LLPVTLSIDCDNSDGSRLDATFNLSKRFFGDQHIDMTLENRGITNFVQSRLPIVSSLIMPSYHLSNASLVATIVVVIAKMVLHSQLALVEQKFQASFHVGTTAG